MSARDIEAMPYDYYSYQLDKTIIFFNAYEQEVYKAYTIKHNALTNASDYYIWVYSIPHGSGLQIFKTEQELLDFDFMEYKK